jgi:hypothetical protein
MLDSIALIAKFGEWSQPYADAVVPVLRQYGTDRVQLSLQRGTNDEEATLTIRAAPSPSLPHYMMDTAKINEIRSEHEAFKRQCIEVVVWPRTRLAEYTFVDNDRSTSAQIQDKHFCCAWNPDRQLTAVVTPAVAAHRAAIDNDMSRNDRLHSNDVKRIRQIVSLYLLSSAEVPEFRVYIEEDGQRLVFVGVRRLSLSWCMHLIRQADIGIDRIQVTDKEIEFTMVPALLETCKSPIQGGPVRNRRTGVTSFISRMRQSISYIM